MYSTKSTWVGVWHAKSGCSSEGNRDLEVVVLSRRGKTAIWPRNSLTSGWWREISHHRRFGQMRVPSCLCTFLVYSVKANQGRSTTLGSRMYDTSINGYVLTWATPSAWFRVPSQRLLSTRVALKCVVANIYISTSDPWMSLGMSMYAQRPFTRRLFHRGP